MSKVTRLILAGAGFALLSILALAADKSNPAVKPAFTKATPLPSAWSPETISGKITMVEPDQKLVVVVSPDGVAYDLVVNGATHIKSGNQFITLKGLEQYQNKNATIKFVPEHSGNVAESIRIG